MPRRIHPRVGFSAPASRGGTGSSHGRLVPNRRTAAHLTIIAVDLDWAVGAVYRLIVPMIARTIPFSIVHSDANPIGRRWSAIQSKASMRRAALSAEAVWRDGGRIIPADVPRLPGKAVPTLRGT